MPFDPDQYLASKKMGSAPAFQPQTPSFEGFDPDAYLAQKASEPPPPEKPDLEAGLQGVGSASTLGYLPQLQAATEPLTFGLLNKLTGQDVKPDKYVEARDKYIQREDKLLERSPKSYGAGYLAGTVGSLAVPGSVAGKLGLATKGLGKLKQAALAGAATGGLMNPGDTEGEINPLQLKERLSNAAAGAAAGGLAQGAAGAVKGIAGIPGKLTQSAEQRAVGAVGATKSDITRLIKKDITGHAGDRARELGKFILDEKLVKAGDDIETISQRIGSKKKESGAALAALYDEASTHLSSLDPSKLTKAQKTMVGKTNFNPIRLGEEILEDTRAHFNGMPGGDKAISIIEKEVKNLQKNGNVSDLKQMQAFKEGIDDLIPYDKGISLMSKPEKEALVRMRSHLKDAIDSRINALDHIVGGERSKELKRLNQAYGRYSEIDRIARNRLASETGNSIMPLSAKFAATGAGLGAAESIAEGHPENALKRAALGAGVGLLAKGAHVYGRPMVTHGLNASGKILGAPGALLKKHLPEEVQKLPSQLTPGMVGRMGAQFSHSKKNEKKK